MAVGVFQRVVGGCWLFYKLVAAEEASDLQLRPPVSAGLREAGRAQGGLEKQDPPVEPCLSREGLRGVRNEGSWPAWLSQMAPVYLVEG